MDRFEKYYDKFHELIQENYCLNLHENLKVYNFIYDTYLNKTPVYQAVIKFAEDNHLIKIK